MNLIDQSELLVLGCQTTGASGHGPYRLFGDSHVLWMTVHHPEIFESHWYIGRTAYNLQKHLDIIMPCIDGRKPNLFLLGTVDARFHIARFGGSKDVERLRSDIETTCSRYLEALKSVRDTAVEVAAISCCPMGSRSMEDWDVWNNIIQESNAFMLESCAKEGIDFIDVYRYWMHPLSGDRAPALIGDEWHLNAAAGHILAVCVHDFYQKKRQEYSQ